MAVAVAVADAADSHGRDRRPSHWHADRPRV